jgi:hypothetical protein
MGFYRFLIFLSQLFSITVFLRAGARGFVRFLGGFCAGCGFGLLIEGFLGHLCGGFVFFVSMVLGLCLF